jgi:hypothetical protein
MLAIYLVGLDAIAMARIKYWRACSCAISSTFSDEVGSFR